MTRLIALLWLALLAPAANLWAQGVRPGPAPAATRVAETGSASRMPPPAAGRTSPAPPSLALTPAPGVLLLRNGNLLRGTVSLLGDRYSVMLDAQNEVRIPVAEVALQCATAVEAYQHKRAALPPGQSAARLDLAEWCLRYGMVTQAAEEATIVTRLDPDHPRLTGISQRIEAAQRPMAAPAAPGTAPSPPASWDQLEQVARDLPVGSVERFTAAIQPVLLNRCGANTCHGPGGRSDYHLLRPPLGQTTTRRFTLRNLHATMQRIQRDTVPESPLLTQARQAHGGASAPPFGANEQAQYESLASWVRQISVPKAPAAPLTIGQADAQLLQNTPLASGQATSSGTAAAAGRGGRRGSAAAEVPSGPDPFDPAAFNRQFVDPPAPPQP
ncbi:MAG: hypothetical protein U0935_03070 [Pirellulales bacterium]